MVWCTLFSQGHVLAAWYSRLQFWGAETFKRWSLVGSQQGDWCSLLWFESLAPREWGSLGRWNLVGRSECQECSQSHFLFTLCFLATDICDQQLWVLPPCLPGHDGLKLSPSLKLTVVREVINTPLKTGGDSFHRTNKWVSLWYFLYIHMLRLDHIFPFSLYLSLFSHFLLTSSGVI